MPTLRNQKITMLLLTTFVWLCCCCVSMAVPTDMLTAPITTLQNCQRKCGNITVPYPFGIGTGCSISAKHNIICITSSNSPKVLFSDSKKNVEIVSISESYVKIRNSLTFNCYDSHGHVRSGVNGSIDLVNSPFTISGKANKFTAIGCDDVSVMVADGTGNITVLGGCITWCSREKELLNGTCSGLGCCQTNIPNGLWNFTSLLYSGTNHTSVPFNPCSYTFLSAEDSFLFTVEELSDPAFMNKTVSQNFPVVLEWTVGDGASCSQAERSGAQACKANTKCSDSTNGIGGYTCHCLPGYEGNPYLGCTDFNECVEPGNPCSGICTNTEGSYECSCPKGQHGDGLKKGTGCTARSSQLATKAGLGVSFGLLLAFLCSSWLYILKRRQRLKKMKEEFFERNGGFLLKQQITSNQAPTEPTMIFSANELSLATKNYSDERVIGAGANGTVYKGILQDGRVVAIKKSKIVDQTQIEQFVNEVIILTQINHRNVVKLLGCCLETEVPLLVYEYISNGSLQDHIRNESHSSSWLTWANCIRIASETADALAYLHSAANIPVIHRDVKSANILISECYTAKVADFGASRLIPVDKSQVTTLVQGTLGYLDPEYFRTGQLTEKSDVYSFGVVLAELLTRKRPILMVSEEDRNLAALFCDAVKADQVLEVIHPRLIMEAEQEQVASMARLVARCLNVKREDRPSMREVSVKVDELRTHIRPSWAHQNNGVPANLTGQYQEHYSVHMVVQGRENAALLPEQYSLQMELITEMSPR